MTSKPRILTLIPARGGSKRIPKKNISPLAGKPLIKWTIDAAVTSGVCSRVYVSTDDEEIADVARAAGAIVPWLRPASLSTDTSTSAEVIAHAVTWYENAHGVVDAVLLLQPTSPFRRPMSIAAAVQKYADQKNPNQNSVVSFSPVKEHPDWTFVLQEQEIQPVFGWGSFSLRSQELRATYRLNGAIYIIPAKHARNAEPIIAPGVLPFIMDDFKEGLDIDTQEDWELASVWAQKEARDAGTALNTNSQ
jgi:CMP-N,N'-diacetyllegionaminic acid synthase